VNEVVSSEFGGALILDSHINLPNDVHKDLTAAAKAAAKQPTADSLDQAVSKEYATVRHTYDTAGRNKTINNAKLSHAHGSFVGW
jgi:hypothetical protein